MTEEWVEADVASKLPPRDEEFRGVHIRVFVSPYNIPEAVRGYGISEPKRFRVEFRYPEQDRSYIPVKHGPLELHVGKSSGRLCKIDVDVAALNVDTVSLELLQAAVASQLEALKQKQEFESQKARRDNLDAVRAALDTTGDRVFAAYSG